MWSLGKVKKINVKFRHYQSGKLTATKVGDLLVSPGMSEQIVINDHGWLIVYRSCFRFGKFQYLIFCGAYKDLFGVFYIFFHMTSTKIFRIRKKNLFNNFLLFSSADNNLERN